MLKFFEFDVIKFGDDGVAISFKVAGLQGVDAIIQAFQSGKVLVENKLYDGIMGFINVATIIYSWIKAGKK